MTSGVFRGKESLNRIEISRLVQDLLNFGILGSLWLWGGVGGWGCLRASGGMRGCPHMHTHTHVHAHTCTHTCIKLQMAANMEASMFRMFIMFNMHVHAYVHACACVCAWDTPLHTHIHPHPHTPICHPPRGWIHGISKNLITLELIKIFQFHLKICNL